MKNKILFAKAFFNEYLDNQDADLFLEKSHLVHPSLDFFRNRLMLLFIGYKDYKWLYDTELLSKVIFRAGLKK